MDLFLRQTPSAQHASVPASAPDDVPHSIAGDAYQKERAYDARRRRRRVFMGVVRCVLAIVLVPLAVALVFVGSYALTCILEGATPDELIQALWDLFDHVCQIACEATRLVGV